MKLQPSERFEKALAGLTQAKFKQVEKAVGLFQQNPRHRSLNFEKVKGTKDAYTIRYNKGDRISLRRLGPKHYLLVDLCDHDHAY